MAEAALRPSGAEAAAFLACCRSSISPAMVRRPEQPRAELSTNLTALLGGQFVETPRVVRTEIAVAHIRNVIQPDIPNFLDDYWLLTLNQPE